MTELEYIKEMQKHLDVLKQVYNRYIFDKNGEEHYILSLRPYRDNPYLFSAMKEIAAGKGEQRFPYVQDIIDKIKEISRRQVKRIETNKEEVCHLDMPAAIGMMYLYYQHKWSFDDVQNTALGRVFKSMHPDDPFDLKKMESIIPKEKAYAQTHPKCA